MCTSVKRQAWRPIPAGICSSTREPDRLQLTLGTERHFHRGNGAARLFEFDQTGKVPARDRPGTLRVRVRAYRPRRSAGQHLDRRRGGRHRSSSSTRKARFRWCSAARLNICRCPTWIASTAWARLPSRRGRSASVSRATSSTGRPTLPGTSKATSSSRTVTSTRASRSSTRTAGFSSHGGRRGPHRASSTSRTRS